LLLLLLLLPPLLLAALATCNVLSDFFMRRQAQHENFQNSLASKVAKMPKICAHSNTHTHTHPLKSVHSDRRNYLHLKPFFYYIPAIMCVSVCFFKKQKRKKVFQMKAIQMVENFYYGIKNMKLLYTIFSFVCVCFWNFFRSDHMLIKTESN